VHQRSHRLWTELPYVRVLVVQWAKAYTYLEVQHVRTKKYGVVRQDVDEMRWVVYEDDWNV
jgi:hypothetical protein